MKIFRSVPALACIATLICAAATDAKGPMYTDPDKSDADFAIQGEYMGDIKVGDETERLAVQVIALGNGEFQCVGYHGGLPGDGWNGESKVIVTSKKNDDGTVAFKDKHGSGMIKDGALHVDLGADGTVDGKLDRVIRKSKTLGQAAPKDAVVLFSGRESIDNWDGKLSDDGLLADNATSKQKFGDHSVHIEFCLPYQPEDRGQGRGNSGIYLQGRYEVQMLDSFGLEGKNNECGGIYERRDPDVNMCFPPLSWQTYDIDFTAAKYDDSGKLVSQPRMTVRHNGVVVHKDVELPEEPTRAAPVAAGAEPGPVYVQGHGCPVRYRNIWVVEKK